MKKLFYLLIPSTLILSMGCTKIIENTDPIIGIWSKTGIGATGTTEEVVVREEWIFNDAYLGRYHLYQGNDIFFLTDFKWDKNDDIYTISYPGTDILPAMARIKETRTGMILKHYDGTVMAIKQ